MNRRQRRIYSPIHTPTQTIQPPIHQIRHSRTSFRLQTTQPIQSLTHMLTHTRTYSFTHCLHSPSHVTHSLPCSLPFPLTHSLSHSFTDYPEALCSVGIIVVFHIMSIMTIDINAIRKLINSTINTVIIILRLAVCFISLDLVPCLITGYV